ncbi:type II toxin-antitoxin system ParD family antitoxin [Alteriqipengyuania sp. 357]
MATIRKTITLSDTQDAWIKRQIAEGGFTNDSEYIRDLVRRDQEGQAKLAGLRQAIAEGLDSGVSDRSLNYIWAEAEKRSAAADA